MDDQFLFVSLVEVSIKDSYEALTAEHSFETGLHTFKLLKTVVADLQNLSSPLLMLCIPCYVFHNCSSCLQLSNIYIRFDKHH